jgi:protein phosphatase
MRDVERVAILSDIHGNSPALEVVLEDINKIGLEHIVFAGDLVMKGLYPAQVLDRVTASHQPSVIGNTDVEVLDRIDTEAQWTANQLRPSDLQFLRNLPHLVSCDPSRRKIPR